MTISGRQEGDTEMVSFNGVSVDESMWILVPKAAIGIALSMLVVLLKFWGEFGYVSMFALGVAVFIAAFEVLLIVGLRFADRPDVRTAVKTRNDVFDRFGGWWLIACAFGGVLRLARWEFGRPNARSMARRGGCEGVFHNDNSGRDDDPQSPLH